MNNLKTQKPDEKSEKKEEKPKEKLAVRINAVKVKLRRPSGIVVNQYAGDVIDKPWPALIEEAKRDKQHRVFSIIHK